MNNWKQDINRDVFVNGRRIVTYEQYEKYRGKYNNPTDELLNAIWELVTK